MPANIWYDGFSSDPHAQNITDAALECTGALSADDALLLAALAEVDAVIASQLLVSFGPRLITRLRWGPWKDLDALAADLRRSTGRTRHEIAGVYEATAPELLPAPWIMREVPLNATDATEVRPEGIVRFVQTHCAHPAPSGDRDPLSGYFIRGYDARSATLHLKHAYLETLPNKLSGAVASLSAAGTPTTAFVTMRQMLTFGIARGSLQRCRVRQIENIAIRQTSFEPAATNQRAVLQHVFDTETSGDPPAKVAAMRRRYERAMALYDRSITWQTEVEHGFEIVMQLESLPPPREGRVCSQGRQCWGFGDMPGRERQRRHADRGAGGEE